MASDTIYREVVRLKEAGKPVIVSMGNVAASGGYYISAPATKIVAQPSTVTGSIGVVRSSALMLTASDLKCRPPTQSITHRNTDCTYISERSAKTAEIGQNNIAAECEDLIVSCKHRCLASST